MRSTITAAGRTSCMRPTASPVRRQAFSTSPAPSAFQLRASSRARLSGCVNSSSRPCQSSAKRVLNVRAVNGRGQSMRRAMSATWKRSPHRRSCPSRSAELHGSPELHPLLVDEEQLTVAFIGTFVAMVAIRNEHSALETRPAHSKYARTKSVLCRRCTGA